MPQALQHKRVVFVGDPGAGKSTFLRRIAFAVCQTLLGKRPEAIRELLGEDQAPFPIVIGAASHANFITQYESDTTRPWPPDKESPQWMVHYLEWKSQESDWGLPPGFFGNKLKGDGLLLLDGLDEAPDRALRRGRHRHLCRQLAPRFVQG